MKWLSDTERKRILDLWLHAYDPSVSVGESANARSMLARVQREHGLSDVELAYIAEREQQQNRSRLSSRSTADSPPDLLDMTLTWLESKGIELDFAQLIVSGLWTLHTYVYDQFNHTPRLVLRSSEPGCGKTVLLTCIEMLANNSFMVGHVTPAVIYRELSQNPNTTFLLDEFENSSLWKEDKFLLSVLDNGHFYNGYAGRVVGAKTIRLPCFAPVTLAMIAGKNLPKQLWSRSIFIDMFMRMRGGAEDEEEDEFVPDDPQVPVIREFMFAWAGAFRRARVIKLPRMLRRNRVADNWRPLIAVADDLGYGATARAAALELHRRTVDPISDLFFGIYQVLVEQLKTDRIWTDDLLPALHALEDAHWDEFRGLSGIDPPHKLKKGELYDMLGGKNIESRSVQKRVGGGRRISRKGFLVTQFEPVWRSLFGEQFAGTSAQFNKITKLAWHGSGTGPAQTGTKHTGADDQDEEEEEHA